VTDKRGVHRQGVGKVPSPQSRGQRNKLDSELWRIRTEQGNLLENGRKTGTPWRASSLSLEPCPSILTAVLTSVITCEQPAHNSLNVMQLQYRATVSKIVLPTVNCSKLVNSRCKW
jgi:hypothetical protein